MICSKCGLEVEKEWEGGWKCTPDRIDYFAHHLCPREKLYIWARWQKFRSNARLVNPEVPVEPVPESLQ
jgi:hypothetical protein